MTQEILDLLGIFVFAVSGALPAVDRRHDVVVLLMMAEITALGGGILRDLVIGAVPPAAFTDLAYVLVPIPAAVLVVLWHPQVNRQLTAVQVFDAAGIGLFGATGTLKALSYGLSPVPATLVGVCTAIGGGMLRDVLSGRVPAPVGDRQLYVVPVLLGAAVVAGGHSLGVRSGLLTLGAAALTFAVRVLAMRYDLRIPYPRGIGREAPPG